MRKMSQFQSLRNLVNLTGRSCLSALLQKQNTCMWKQGTSICRITTKATQNNDNATLDVTFKGEDKHHSYPFIWLRDNCQCDKCYGQTSHHRYMLTKHLDISIKPQHVEVDTNKDISITWPDNHCSKFSAKWLQERSFQKNDRQSLGPAPLKNIKNWGGELQDNIPQITYDKLMSDDKALYQWIETLEATGIYLIVDAPGEPDILDEIGKRVAFLRMTHYGLISIVKSKPNPSNIAYNEGCALGLHTDLSYYNYTPGMQMLHCISQVPSEGGANEFADGFYVAKLMKEEHPDLYQVLLDTPVRFIDIGADHIEFHQVHETRSIEEDKDGNVVKINWNNHSRSSFTGMTSEGIKTFYKALTTFEALLNDHRCMITHKLKTGDIICFHNYRVLHGRRKYKVVGIGGERYLEAAYIDWDEMHSKRRVLEDKLGLTESSSRR